MGDGRSKRQMYGLCLFLRIREDPGQEVRDEAFGETFQRLSVWSAPSSLNGYAGGVRAAFAGKGEVPGLIWLPSIRTVVGHTATEWRFACRAGTDSRPSPNLIAGSKLQFAR